MGAPALPPTWQLYLMNHRMSTFKNWPFLEGCSCTPERVSSPRLGTPVPPLWSDSCPGLTAGGVGPRVRSPTLASHCGLSCLVLGEAAPLLPILVSEPLRLWAPLSLGPVDTASIHSLQRGRPSPRPRTTSGNDRIKTRLLIVLTSCAVVFRWRKLASSTALLTMSLTWPSVFSALRSWKAGNQMTTLCKSQQATRSGFPGALVPLGTF